MINLPTLLTNETTGFPHQVTGWSVSRSLSQCYATGQFSMLNAENVKMQDILRFDVTLPVGSVVTLISGRVVSMDFDDSNVMSVGIESLAGIMSRNDAEPTDWTYSTAQDVIEAVCGEFDVPVTFDPALSPSTVPGAIVIDEGTPALSAIIEICKANGWVLLDDNDGGLLITSVGSQSYDLGLVRGLPPLVSGSFSVSDMRARTTTAKAIIPAVKRKGKKTVGDVVISGTATDAGALAGTRRFLRSDKALTTKDLEYQAAVQSLIMGAGGLRYAATCSGLVTLDGELWQPNRLVTVSDPVRRVIAWTGLIDGVTMRQSAGSGQTTTLDLVPPATYFSDNPDAIEGATGTDPYRGLDVWR